jgi:hypothetical protein
MFTAAVVLEFPEQDEECTYAPGQVGADRREKGRRCVAVFLANCLETQPR